MYVCVRRCGDGVTMIITLADRDWGGRSCWNLDTKSEMRFKYIFKGCQFGHRVEGACCCQCTVG